MFEFLGDVLSGGLTGLLGTGLTFWFDYLKQKQRHEQEVELRELDLKMAQQEAESAERIAGMEMESEADQRAHELQAASIKAETTRISEPGDSPWLIFVDVVRGLIRPALTVLFVLLSALIYFTLDEDEPVTEMQAMVISTILYLATASTLWWFGARALSKSGTGVGIAPR